MDAIFPKLRRYLLFLSFPFKETLFLIKKNNEEQGDALKKFIANLQHKMSKC